MLICSHKTLYFVVLYEPYTLLTISCTDRAMGRARGWGEKSSSFLSFLCLFMFFFSLFFRLYGDIEKPMLLRLLVVIINIQPTSVVVLPATVAHRLCCRYYFYCYCTVTAAVAIAVAYCHIVVAHSTTRNVCICLYQRRYDMIRSGSAIHFLRFPPISEQTVTAAHRH